MDSMTMRSAFSTSFTSRIFHIPIDNSVSIHTVKLDNYPQILAVYYKMDRVSHQRITASNHRNQSNASKPAVQPIYLLFKLLQNKTPVQVWLYECPKIRLEGIVLGFDEFMNVVLGNVHEIRQTSKGRNAHDDSEQHSDTNEENDNRWTKREFIGERIMLRGDNITLIRSLSP